MRSLSIRNKISLAMKGHSNFDGKSHTLSSKKKIGDARGHDDRIGSKKWVVNKVTGKTSRVTHITTDTTRYGRSLKSFREWIEE